jgi:6-phosphogluconolactonase (cycloisomerase 2 family)
MVLIGELCNQTKNINMKQFLFLLLFPCLALAQYPGNSGQKISLGEQTTADGLVYRGVENDTSLITPFSDTSAYIILDTVNNRFFHYKRNTNVWSVAGGSDTSLIAYVNTYGTQTVNGVKTFNDRIISTNAMHFVDTALSIVSFAKKTVQPNGMVGVGSGVLSTKTDYTTGSLPFSVAVDPTGRFLYVANYSSATVSMFVINQTNGTLNTKTDYTTGTNPYSVAVDPTGRFLYVANYSSNTVSMFVINQTDGTLNTKTDYTTGSTPSGVNVDPTGRFLYVANFGSNTVSMFVINQTDGTLNTKTDYTTGTNPLSVNVDPTARFLYVANYSSNTVSMFVINQTNGTLNTKTDYTTGSNPSGVNVDPTGRFLYVANYGSNTVSQYFLQSFSVGGAYIAGRLSVGVDSAQTNYSVNIGTTFKQDSLFVGGRVTAVGYTTRSDIDAKENITPINYGINEVMALEPVAYNYLNEENKSLGFIAQDIGLIIPEAISWETPFSVYYQYLIPILTKAIQEQQALIKSLQQRLLILENK